jgi:hypothetical protein
MTDADREARASTAVGVIDRAAVLEVLARLDFDDDRITWRIRRRA